MLKKPDVISDPKTLQNIGKMVTDGTLLSLDDFWSFQSNLYQTIITVLIALNG
ncbi:transmembrane HD family hydrolase, partial [Escherichia coli]|nr:transmembrane HD family hydrolase [Escherichia coli]